MPCTHAASTQQVLLPWVQDGKEMTPSRCLHTQVSSEPSRTSSDRATCSTSAPQLYHTWKHSVPAAPAVPSSCPATQQAALWHSLRCASATPATRAEPSPPPAVGSRSARGSHAPPRLPQLLTLPWAKQAPEQCRASRDLGKE